MRLRRLLDEYQPNKDDSGRYKRTAFTETAIIWRHLSVQLGKHPDLGHCEDHHGTLWLTFEIHFDPLMEFSMHGNTCYGYEYTVFQRHKPEMSSRLNDFHV
jgi:hypothetical protein